MTVPFDAYPEVLSTTDQVRAIISQEQPDISPERLEIALSAARLAALYSVPRLFAARHEQSTAAYESQTDSMTGLHNKRGFDSILEHTLGRALTNQVPLSLVFMYFDNLKLINDTEGHQAGDDAIVKVANILRQYVQPDNTSSCEYTVSAPARFEGGDDFGVLLANATQQDATDWWNGLDAAFRASDVVMCTGIVTYDPATLAMTTPDTLYADAHGALLTARLQGGTYLA